MNLFYFLKYFFKSWKLQLFTRTKIITNPKNKLLIFIGPFGFLIFHYFFIQQYIVKAITYQYHFWFHILDELLHIVESLVKCPIFFKGVGYKFFVKKSKFYKIQYLKLKAGYNTPIIFKFKNSQIRLKNPKPTRLIIHTKNSNLLYTFTRFIYKYRKSNCYTGKGFRFRRTPIRRKLVQKSK